MLNWTDDQIEDLINRVYGGVVSTKALPMDLYEAILERMDESIMDGFGDIDGTVSRSNMFLKFSENIKQFSFAKTFQQINDMGNFILDKDGNQILFSEFKKSAAQIFDIYNNNWLETEFNTAKSIAESARQWADIQDTKDVLPLLRYVTVGDGRVRASHRSLDGITRPVDDPFWDTHYVPNDFNCRCIIEQVEEGEVTDLDGLELDPINPLFRNNPAKTGEVFSKKDHPYFNGLGQMLKAPIKDILPKPKPVAQKYTFKNNNEAKAAIIRDIQGNSKLEIGKVTISTSLDASQVSRRADTIRDLFSEYNLSDRVVPNEIYKTDIVLKSTRRYYGVVKSAHIGSGEAKKRIIVQVNFGDATDTVASRSRASDSLRSKSAVDPENIEIATTVHEFAHVIAVSSEVVYTVFDNNKKFFVALEKIRAEYSEELAKLANEITDPKKLKEAQLKIHLGKYASTNLNEFMAEGFTEYKLSKKPSKYAKKIGETIDKYYKK